MLKQGMHSMRVFTLLLLMVTTNSVLAIASSVVVEYGSTYPYGISFTIGDTKYAFQPGEHIEVILPGGEEASSLFIWECIGNDCHWDGPYEVRSGGHYRIVDSGQQDWDLKLIQISQGESGLDVDHDGISDEYELDLAEKYAPCFIFDPREDYFYMDPTDFINKCGRQLNSMFSGYGNPNRPGFADSDCWKVGLLLGTKWIPSDGIYPPANMSFSQFISGYNEKSVRTYDPEMHRLLEEHSINGRLPWENVRIRPPAWRGAYYLIFDKALKYRFNPNAPVFFLVEINAEGNMELQYWQFSHCDDKNLETDYLYQVDHLCDWSRVVLVFAANSDKTKVIEPPLYAFYSCHKSPLHAGDAPFNPRYLVWNDIHLDKDGHPIVLVSHNQHELYFENNALPVYPYPGKTYEEDIIRYGSCTIRPYYIKREVGHDYFDQVGHGIVFVPSRKNLANLQNGDHPNRDLPWLTFGGKWFDGPEGPLGPGASVRFRQHCIWKTVFEDDGSVENIYKGLSEYGNEKWRKQCKGITPTIVTAVLWPQGFNATADAYLKGKFGR